MGRTLAYLLCAVITLGIVGSARVATAQEAAASAEKTVVVVIDAGDTDLLVESLVRSTAEAELRKRGFTLVENAEVGGDIPQRLLACAGNRDCSVQTLAGIEARFVIFISLRPDEEGSSSNFKIVARNYEVETGTALARTMRRCAECQEEVDLAAFSEGVIVDLIKEPEPKPAQPKPVAPAPVAPTQPKTVQPPVLTKPLARAKKDEGSAVVTVFKYGTLLGGLGGLAGGTVLVLMDGPVIEDGVRQPEENDTLLAGYGTLAAGAALLGLSAWLFAIDGDDSTPRAAVLPSSDGGAFVVSGRF